MLESCRRSSGVNFHFWLWAASSTNVRYRALRAAWTISVSSKSLMLRRIGTWKLMGARSIRNVIRTCASCFPRASTSIRATVILNLLIPSLGLLLRKRHPFADDFSPRLVFGLHAQDPLPKRWSDGGIIYQARLWRPRAQLPPAFVFCQVGPVGGRLSRHRSD